jgi:RPA family protein
MPSQQKRQTAYKVKISELLSGSYIKEDGWQPNYIILKNNLQVSRVNVIGTVLSIQNDPNLTTVIIDDGSGIMPLRIFEKNSPLPNLAVGDIVQVIGRPRQYGSERYILMEICKKTSQAWLRLRRFELQKQTPIIQTPLQKNKKPEIEHIRAEEPIDTSENKVIECVKKLDAGQGADYEEVLKQISNEQAVKDLLERGDLFEIKPGKLKVLE